MEKKERSGKKGLEGMLGAAEHNKNIQAVFKIGLGIKKRQSAKNARRATGSGVDDTANDAAAAAVMTG